MNTSHPSSDHFFYKAWAAGNVAIPGGGCGTGAGLALTERYNFNTLLPLRREIAP